MGAANDEPIEEWRCCRCRVGVPGDLGARDIATDQTDGVVGDPQSPAEALPLKWFENPGYVDGVVADLSSLGRNEMPPVDMRRAALLLGCDGDITSSC